jgi:hypothetical protein
VPTERVIVFDVKSLCVSIHNLNYLIIKGTTHNLRDKDAACKMGKEFVLQNTESKYFGRYTRCDPKVLRRVILKEYCALYLVTDTITT